MAPVPLKFVKKGDMAVLECLVRMLNANFHMKLVPMDWRGARIFGPCTKGKVTSLNVVTR